MKVIHSIHELELARAQLGDAQVGLVPTMGALHPGHLSLVEIARKLTDVVVLSIFVNPLQFGPEEDYARYPRPLQQDLEACEKAGVEIVFNPGVNDLFPAARQVSVQAGSLGAVFEGASRPGHFDGMLTVVLKLLNLVQPTIALFGRKDAQQLASVKRMVTDLNVDVEIVPAPIVREADGLAMSSRNQYLSPPDRQSAQALWRALKAASGEVTASAARRTALEVLDQAALDNPNFVLDYAEVVDPDTFAVLDDEDSGPALLAAAALVGTTRLIDNVELTLAAPTEDDSADNRVGAARTS
ncbi:pantoate--beta-alanine ligase [Microlunatus parietis]|uniref:Pantothenate synthetase n=1 Tax=Microlunatus parietis TaxID=682979 RepID=A0A7Y9I8N1_9ACTN|nr:pantoate--beta-alanine ligase [Microlunatus parietis]NYE72348.1 pantoate--beta-alanine ligase [Microlunatus parietis]